jgi:hypothetical protein
VGKTWKKVPSTSSDLGFCQVMALLPSDSFNFLADGWDESKETPDMGLGLGSLGLSPQEEPADLEKLGGDCL